MLSIPDFVLRPIPPRELGVPLLLFHWVHPTELDGYLGWLRAAGYRSLSSDEVAGIARGESARPPRSVALTFDDGVYNNWAVVAPLLRRHGFRGTAFVIPRLLADGPRRPTLEDVEAGRAALPDVLDDGAAGRYMTWDEATVLATEGVLEIQSHTYDHAQVFTSDRLIDFQHPLADGSPRYPWLWTALGTAPEEPAWGAPVYTTAPRMEGRRYHDDTGFRDACRKFVAIRGERGFFADVTWREELSRFAGVERRRHGRGRLETLADTRRERFLTLVRAREVLRDRLGRATDHVALPWSRGAADSPRLIRDAGYRSGYTRERPSERLQPGVDPFDLARVEGYWLRSLPAPGRVGLSRRIAGRVARLVPSRFLRADTVSPW